MMTIFGFSEYMSKNRCVFSAGCSSVRIIPELGTADDLVVSVAVRLLPLNAQYSFG